MHRSTASMIFGIVIAAAACGGRIAQGSDGESDESAPPDVGADASTALAMVDAALLSTACGAETCAGNDECCVGAAPGNTDPNASLEACSHDLCNTELEVGCWTSTECPAGEVCCITVDPNSDFPSSSCASRCGGDGQPAVQVCAGDGECPQGFGCFIASMGVAGENRNVQICGGAR